jgi:hypothetical protein
MKNVLNGGEESGKVGNRLDAVAFMSSHVVTTFLVAA